MIKAFALASLQAYIAVAAEDATVTTDVKVITDTTTLGFYGSDWVWYDATTSSCGVENMTGWTTEDKEKNMGFYTKDWAWHDDGMNNPYFCCESKILSCDEWSCHCEDTGMQMLRADFAGVKKEIKRLVEDLSHAGELKEEVKRQADAKRRNFECWWSDRNAGDGKCYHRDLVEKRQECYDKVDGSRWDWDTDYCMSKAEYEERDDYKKLMMAKYINLQATSTDETAPADRSESREVETEEAFLLPGEEGYCSQKYSSQEECDCNAEMDAYLYDFEDLLEQPEMPLYVEGVCHANMEAYFESALAGMDLVGIDLKKKQAIRAMRNPRALMSVAGKISGPTVKDIYAPVTEGGKQGEQLAESMGKDLEALAGELQQWGKQWEEFGNAQKKREEEAFNELAEYLFDSVTVDGKTLRDTFGNPQDLMNGGRDETTPMPKTAKSMLKQLTMQSMKDDVSFSFDIPQEAEVDAFLSATEAQFRNITGSLEDMVNEYYPQQKALNDAVEDVIDAIMKDQVGAQVNSTGDFVKTITDTLDYSLDSVTLAQTHAQAESSNTNAYAGAAFGVIGLAAILALVSTCNKKADQQNQEALL